MKPWLEYKERELLFREAVLHFLGVKDEKAKESKKTEISQKELDLQEIRKKMIRSVGQYCNGKNIMDCRSYFGYDIARVCYTCPN